MLRRHRNPIDQATVQSHAGPRGGGSAESRPFSPAPKSGGWNGGLGSSALSTTLDRCEWQLYLLTSCPTSSQNVFPSLSYSSFSFFVPPVNLNGAFNQPRPQ